MIKATKRIFNSDKICRSYCDFYFGVAFWNTLYTYVPSRIRVTTSAELLLVCVLLPQCSFSVCLKSFKDNERAVDEFGDQWRVRVADR